MKIIERISPKIKILLNLAAIHTMTQFQNVYAEHISRIFENAGKSFQMHDPVTWSTQAGLVIDQKWTELREWQKELAKGR